MLRTFKKYAVCLMGVLYVLAGVRHFTDPDFYLQIMPPYLPSHLLLVQLSGVAEILVGFGLLFTKTRKLAAWGLIALLIAIFPSNIYMWTDNVAVNGQTFPAPLHILRLLFQSVLIYWAWVYTRDDRSLNRKA